MKVAYKIKTTDNKYYLQLENGDVIVVSKEEYYANTIGEKVKLNND